jgi:hypothetical protein
MRARACPCVHRSKQADKLAPASQTDARVVGYAECLGKCASHTTARFPLHAASQASPVDTGPRTHSLCRNAVLSSPGNLKAIVSFYLLGAEGVRLVVTATSRISSVVDF